MEMEEVQVVEETVGTVATEVAKSSRPKGLIIGGATLAVCGLAVGGFFLVRHIRAKRAAKMPEQATTNE